MGFFLQIADAFPEHREVRKAVLLLVLGFFAGAVVSSVKGEALDFSGSLSPSHILVASCAAFPVLFAAWAALLQDARKRAELFTVSGVGTAVFVIVFACVGLTNVARQADLTFEESTSLASFARGRGDYARAIELLNSAGIFIEDDDPRKVNLKSHIEQLKLEQVRHALK